jgi:hypothetical protein
MPEKQLHEVVSHFTEAELDFLGIKNLSEAERAEWIKTRLLPPDFAQPMEVDSDY